MLKEPLGLDPPTPCGLWEDPRYRFLGQPPVIPEGRDTFFALVPDRFKPQTTDPPCSKG